MRYVKSSDLKLPKRLSRSHKGENGRVLIAGGSKDYAGAPALAGIAALRSGADIVVVGAPEKVAWSINSLNPDLITRKLKGEYLSVGHYPEIAKLSKNADVLLFGNGAGTGKETVKLFRKLSKLDIQKVIDADGIKAVMAGDLRDSIITPHRRELEIFLESSKLPIDLSVDALKKNLKSFFENNNVLLLKGRIDIILGKNKIAYNKIGNPGMTRGGTGDVLAGLCAGFYSQIKEPFQSAVNAAYINGLAGDNLLKQKKWYTYLASDLAEETGRVGNLINR